MKAYQLELWNTSESIAFLFRRVAEAQEAARMWEDIAECQISGPYLDGNVERLIIEGAEVMTL